MEKPRAGVEINRSKLKEISEVSIDTSKPCEERVRDFIKQTRTTTLTMES